MKHPCQPCQPPLQTSLRSSKPREHGTYEAQLLVQINGPFTLQSEDSCPEPCFWRAPRERRHQLGSVSLVLETEKDEVSSHLFSNLKIVILFVNIHYLTGKCLVCEYCTSIQSLLHSFFVPFLAKQLGGLQFNRARTI